jgi:hypothetical protein
VATKHPRMAITLPAGTMAVLAKLSALQKRPRSAIAADLLEEMTPALQRIATLLEAATKNRAQLPKDTASKLNELEAVLGHIAQFGLDRLATHVTGTGTDKAGARRAPPGRRRKPGPPVQ